MRVHVDQPECTGSGQCELLVPEVFVIGDEGLATVRNPDGSTRPDGGAPLGAPVPADLIGRVQDAADVCPGGCIRCRED